MDIHKPKPVRNWREFLKEYAIIVIGVLTALAGEEMVVTVHHRFEVENLRKALHQELAWNLAALKDTADDFTCAEQRVKELKSWKALLQSGRTQLPQIEIPKPRFLIFRTSTWRSTAAGALDNFPLDERAAYAQLYDGVDNNTRIRDGILLAWQELSDFEEARSVSAEDIREISRHIREIDDGYRRIAGNYKTWTEIFVPTLHLRIDESPLRVRYESGVTRGHASVCKSIIPG